MRQRLVARTIHLLSRRGLRVGLACGVVLAGPAGSQAAGQDAIYRASCRAWARQVASVIERRAATGTLDQREVAMHAETMENLADRCTTPYAANASVLLQRLHNYLVNEVNQP